MHIIAVVKHAKKTVKFIIVYAGIHKVKCNLTYEFTRIM